MTQSGCQWQMHPSHALHFPDCHWICVDRSSSNCDLTRPCSFTAGMLAWPSDRRTREVIHRERWRVILYRHSVWSKTVYRRVYERALDTDDRSRRPTATTAASSSKRRPQHVMGSACSQSPLWGADSASRRARGWWWGCLACKFSTSY